MSAGGDGAALERIAAALERLLTTARTDAPDFPLNRKAKRD